MRKRRAFVVAMLFQLADEARISVAAFVFLVNLRQKVVALLRLDGQQNRVDISFHAITRAPASKELLETPCCSYARQQNWNVR